MKQGRKGRNTSVDQNKVDQPIDQEINITHFIDNKKFNEIEKETDAEDDEEFFDSFDDEHYQHLLKNTIKINKHNIL